MANTSSRALQLLALLQTHRHWSGTDLAERLDVSLRTLRRDVDRLRELGYPVQAQRGVDGGYQLAPGASLPPLVLDDDEAVAVAIGMQAAVTTSGVAGIEESSVRALSKIVQVMPIRLRRQIDALAAMTQPGSWRTSSPAVDAGVLVMLAQACRDAERLEFTYSDQAGETTDRLTDPHRLVSLGQRWYLIAWDLTRHDWRIFRLDRMSAPHVTHAQFQRRELPSDAVEYVRSRIENRPKHFDVSVRIFDSINAVGPRVGPWGSVERDGADCCILKMTTESLEWPIMAIGTIGADFEVLNPPELRDYMGEWCERFGRGLAIIS